LKNILTEPEGKVRYPAKFIYLTDHDDEPLVEDGFLTWYDARQKARVERQVMRWEYRLYFPANAVLQVANAGDILVIAKLRDNSLLAIVAEAETTISRQVLWLFGFSDLSHPGFSVREELEADQDRIEFASRFILESIGIVVEASEESWLDDMIEKFGLTFPSTKLFSSYARSTLSDINVTDGPDDVLMAWMEREEILFRTLEKHIIGERLSEGFRGDVDGFIQFSLSVQNRRKSRAGLALENHLEIIFDELGVRYSRGKITENKSKPDFIFPGIEEYKSSSFDARYLTMLGVKFTSKDRWRQVLAEADRIYGKHLITLEAAISPSQTDEMKAKNLQLVLPRNLHKTCSDDQRLWLFDLATFTKLVLNRQIF
ncbi:MAG: type II restriction endonuclease, partial [Pyrinomonadaceae bacterium]